MNKQENDGSCHRAEAFQQLVEHVQMCRLCPRMEGRSRVLGLANGNIHARVMFVAEAPGRLGADRSHIPLFGDQTGRNFEMLLEAANMKRTSVFVTNAVLCNPQDSAGHNATPTNAEVVGCSAHLQQTLEIIEPQYVVALGVVALSALQGIAPHNLMLARDVGCPTRWYERWLIPFYHPGPRACIHRPLAVQLDDYRRLGQFVSSTD